MRAVSTLHSQQTMRLLVTSRLPCLLCAALRASALVPAAIQQRSSIGVRRFSYSRHESSGHLGIHNRGVFSRRHAVRMAASTAYFAEGQDMGELFEVNNLKHSMLESHDPLNISCESLSHQICLVGRQSWRQRQRRQQPLLCKVVQKCGRLQTKRTLSRHHRWSDATRSHRPVALANAQIYEAPPALGVLSAGQQPKSLGRNKPRKMVHAEGDWHRAVHVWLMNPNVSRATSTHILPSGA